MVMSYQDSFAVFWYFHQMIYCCACCVHCAPSVFCSNGIALVLSPAELWCMNCRSCWEVISKLQPANPADTSTLMIWGTWNKSKIESESRVEDGGVETNLRSTGHLAFGFGWVQLRGFLLPVQIYIEGWKLRREEGAQTKRWTQICGFSSAKRRCRASKRSCKT